MQPLFKLCVGLPFWPMSSMRKTHAHFCCAQTAQTAQTATYMQPLFKLCVGLLVEHVECIDSLAGVPDVMRVQLAQAVCASCKLEPEVGLIVCVYVCVCV